MSKKGSKSKPPSQSKDETQSVYFDGDCPMCSSFAAGFDEGPITAKNLRSEQLPDHISREEAIAQMHFLDAEGVTHRGPRAVLKALETKPRWKTLARLAQCPPFIWLAPLFYSFIASNRFALFGSFKRLTLIKCVVSLAVLLPMLLTHRLWLGNWQRAIPSTPLFSSMPDIGFPLDIVLYTALLTLLLLCVLKPDPRPYIKTLIPLLALYACFDVNRFMPYYIEFGCLLLALGYFPWPRDSAGTELEDEKNNCLSICALILIGIWFWSGVHKLNITYLMLGFPWLISPLTQSLPTALAAQIDALAIATPLIEILAALLLLSKHSRFWGVLLIYLMHVFILICIGPFGHAFNPAVWSWNIAHLLLVYLVFVKTDLSFRSIALPGSLAHACFFLIFILMPVLGFSSLWPRQLAFALYTWSSLDAEIVTSSASALGTEPSRVDPIELTHSLSVRDWAYRELHSPLFDTHGVYLNTFKSLCARSSDPQLLRMILYSRPDTLSGLRQERAYQCQSAKKF